MKRIFHLLISISLCYQAEAQDKLMLQHYAGKEIYITISKDKATITKGSESKQYDLSNNQGIYRLANTQALSEIYSFLAIDTNEIITQLSNALPNMSAAEMLINKAGANNSTALIVKPSDSDIMPTDQVIDEEGGRLSPEQSDENNPTNIPQWLWYIIPAIITLLIGYAIGRKNSSKGTPPITTAPLIDESVSTEEDTVDEIQMNNADDIIKAKDKIKTLQAEKRKLNASLKKANEEKNLSIQEAEKLQKFQTAYYTQAMKELVIPFANAATNGDRGTMVSLAFKMVAHYSSKARHEVQNRQPYDAVNIANLLQQQIEQGNIPVITNSFPADQIPNYIHNIIQIMETVDAKSLGSTVMMGYKIAKS